MSKICELLKKHKQIILYLVFGVLTTVVNIVAYWVFAYPLSLNTILSTILAWLLSVVFAFVTNKFFVFEKKTSKNLAYEILTFFASRLLTGGLDTLIMFVFVDILLANDILIKVISNIVVIILNFVLSKIIVFKKERMGAQK